MIQLFVADKNINLFGLISIKSDLVGTADKNTVEK